MAPDAPADDAATALFAATVKPDEDVLFRNLDGEAVLVHLGSGTYFGLDETGTFIWERMVEHEALPPVLAAVLEAFEVDEATAKADLVRLVGELQEAGLVTVAPKGEKTEEGAEG